MDPTHPPRAHMNPYLAGFGLGLVLLSAFVFMGRGLGASSAFSTVVAALVQIVSPDHVASNEFYSSYLVEGQNPLMDWLVFEVLGVFVGGLASGLIASRARFQVEKGPRVPVWLRLSLAVAGGALMGFGAKLAGGCTSGQALTGGALLNVGSWVTMMCIFGGAYALAWFGRRLWT